MEILLFIVASFELVVLSILLGPIVGKAFSKLNAVLFWLSEAFYAKARPGLIRDQLLTFGQATGVGGGFSVTSVILNHTETVSTALWMSLLALLFGVLVWAFAWFFVED